MSECLYHVAVGIFNLSEESPMIGPHTGILKCSNFSLNHALVTAVLIP